MGGLSAAVFFRRKKAAPPTLAQRLEGLRRQGFSVEPSSGGWRVAKHGCAAAVDPSGRLIEGPGMLIGGEIAGLLDRGYQKFLYTRARGEQPAQAEQLRAIHDFSRELMALLELPALYNQSLGTVSSRYHYDRLEGRK